MIVFLVFHRPKPEKTKDSMKEDSDVQKAGSRIGSRPQTPAGEVPLYDKDLIRMLAEVNFVNGEVITHFDPESIAERLRLFKPNLTTYIF